MSITIQPAVEPQHQHVVLSDVSWETYEKLVEDLAEQHLKLTYDEGVLEIMSPLPEHEAINKVIAGFIELAAVALSIPMLRLGATTWKRKSLRKGTEGDESYYIRHARQMRGRKRIDLRRDPPPDLVIEVYIAYFEIDKRKLYAAMGVPELWSYDGGQISILQLKRGKYEPREASVALPFIRRADLQRFLDMLEEEEETAVLQAWLRFVRKQA